MARILPSFPNICLWRTSAGTSIASSSSAPCTWSPASNPEESERVVDDLSPAYSPLTKDIGLGLVGAQGPDVENLLKQLVKAAHANVSDQSPLPTLLHRTHRRVLQHVKVVLSIGGREGSQYFSSMMPQNGDEDASALVSSIHALKSEYNLDGFDFEYVLSLLSLVLRCYVSERAHVAGSSRGTPTTAYRATSGTSPTAATSPCSSAPSAPKTPP